MATQSVTDPILLDSTGQLIKSALLQIKDAVQPTNVGVDMPLSIPVSAWPNSAPYEFTWLNTKVTPECVVSVGYGEGAENIDTLYLYATKVAGGVKFTTPEKPVTAIPVVIHILNAAAESITAVDADMVATDAVNGASNVDQALSVLDTEIGDLTNLATTEKGSLVGAANELKNTITTINSKISDYTDANGNVKPIENPNFNDLKTSGRYFTTGTGSNGPLASIIGHLDVGYYYGFVKQVFTHYSSNRTFVRINNGSSWSTWEELALNSKISNIKTVSKTYNFPSGTYNANTEYELDNNLGITDTILAISVSNINVPACVSVYGFNGTNLYARFSNGFTGGDFAKISVVFLTKPSV